MNLVAATIFIIHSYGIGTVWPTSIEKGFKEELVSSGYTGKFEVVHLPTLKKEDVLRRIDIVRPVAVLLTSEPACEVFIHDLMQRRVSTFFVSIPKKLSDIKWLNPEYKNYVTGVLERTRMDKAVQILEKITKKPVLNLGILAGGPTLNIKDLAKLVEHEMTLHRPQVKVKVEYAEFYSDWKKKVVELAKSSDAIIPLLPFDMRESPTAKDATSWKEVNEYLVKNVSTPTIGVGFMGTDIKRLMGLTMRPDALGRQTASQVYLHIFKNRSLGAIPVAPARFHELEINTAYLERLKLTLPPEIASYANFR